MKSFIAVLAVVAVAAADVSHIVAQARSGDAAAEVLSQSSDVQPDQFVYGFSTSNGISGQQSGVLKAVGQDVAISVQGKNSYTGPDGVVYDTEFVADENGYQPRGSHLPTPPPPQPIPDYILKSIDYIASQPKYVEPSYKA